MKYDENKQAALIMSMLGSKKPRIIEAAKKWLYDNEVAPEILKQQDPKEFERMQWQKKAEMLESEKLTREKALKEQEEAGNIASIKEAYRVALGKSMVSNGLPLEDPVVRQVMEKARLYIRAGKYPDFDNCCKLVQADFIAQTKSILGKATVDNILNLLDGETAQTINKALLKALDKKDELPTDPNAPRSQKPRKQKEKTPEERKRWLRNIERGIVD